MKWISLHSGKRDPLWRKMIMQANQESMDTATKLNMAGL
jgi:hypothetical protein